MNEMRMPCSRASPEARARGTWGWQRKAPRRGCPGAAPNPPGSLGGGRNTRRRSPKGRPRRHWRGRA
eukprot:7925012-Lingulodinium_polyedra.AAC.1